METESCLKWKPGLSHWDMTAPVTEIVEAVGEGTKWREKIKSLSLSVLGLRGLGNGQEKMSGWYTGMSLDPRITESCWFYL